MPFPFHVQEHVVSGQHIREYPHATSRTQEDLIKIAVKQYTPIDNPKPVPGDITILATHGNGAPKELYEPLWEDLYHHLKRSCTFNIRSIWMADQSHQGASYILNEKKLGNDPSWNDHPRDLFQLVNDFRDQMTQPIIGVAHSMGGGNIVELSWMHPRLFAGLVLLDPTIERSLSIPGYFGAAYMSTFRRDVWPSREAAAVAFAKNKFYASWDARAFDRWLQYGLRELPTLLYPTYPTAPSKPGKSTDNATPPPDEKNQSSGTPVTLTTPKYQEVRTYLRANFPSRDTPLVEHKPDRRKVADLPSHTEQTKPFYRPEPLLTFQKLPHLRPPCFMLFAGKSQFYTPEFVADFISNTGVASDGNGGAAEGAVKHILLEDVGHFLPIEKPDEVAKHMCDWLKGRIEAWREEADLERREWEQTSLRDRNMLSEDYIHWLKLSHEETSPGQRARADKL